jgi:hypothetical protein
MGLSMRGHIMNGVETKNGKWQEVKFCYNTMDIRLCNMTLDGVEGDGNVSTPYGLLCPQPIMGHMGYI